MRKAITMVIGLGLSLLPSIIIQSQEASRTIDVHAKRFAFDPSEISLHAGETVRLRVVSDDVPHSLVVKDLKIDITATKSSPGEFVFKANTPGDYPGRCGRFCGSGHGRMVFTVHVNPN